MSSQPRKKIVPPHVVYHVAGMGDWKEVVDEQLQLLQQVGLTGDIRITYLGKDLEWLENRLNLYCIDYTIIRSDENTDHCETFAMMEIDRLAKVEKTNRPILYMHTKGVSNPGNVSKRAWRHLMEAWVVRRWRINLNFLHMYDAVGVNWIQGGPQHFSGTFWIASPDWIRRLPPFEGYHNTNGSHRYTCELWIGSVQWCKALSLGCKDEPFWNFGYDYGRWMPKRTIVPNVNAELVKSTSSFGKIFDYFNSDKDNEHSYGDVYNKLFPTSVRDSIENVFEVGIWNGASLQAWETAFPNSTVYGIDTNTSVEMIGQRTHVNVCNSVVPRQVFATFDKWGITKGQFDLIVDDGSHRYHDQIATASIMMPYLSKKGIYVIEDIYPFVGAAVLAEMLGGVVLDRRALKVRFDDVMVVIGKDRDFLEDLQRRSDKDIPTIFPCDEI